MFNLRSRGRLRPSPATLIACLALFVALGGSALAAGAVITSNSQVGPDTIAGRGAIKLGKTDNIIDGTIASDDLGAKSVNLSKLGPGIAGPSASSRVDALGHILQETGQPVVTLQAKGDYCVSVPGRSPLTSSIVVSPDLEHDGTRQSGATEAHSTIVETDGACAGVLDDNHGFRVRTFDQRVNNNPVVLPADDGFTFIVS